MRKISISGRERCVLRAIDFTNGSSGEEMLEHTRLDPEDLLDVANGLITVGYVESVPYADPVLPEALKTTTFEVNPSYALQLRKAMIRG